MKRSTLAKMIAAKQAELTSLVTAKKSLQDRDVYQKSLELDDLVVKYMKAAPRG